MDETWNSKLYKLAISDFLNFGFKTQKHGKVTLKNDHKIKILQNFSKTRIYVREPAVVNKYAKFQIDTIIFEPQKGCFLSSHSAHWWRHTFQCNFVIVVV